MRPQTKTKIGLLTLVGLALVLEGLSFLWGDNSTISEITWGLTDHPLVYGALCFVLGHLLWQSQIVYEWAKGRVDYVKRGGLESYHELREEGLSEQEATVLLQKEGYVARYGGIE